jgi:hypothetical protein
MSDLTSTSDSCPLRWNRSPSSQNSVTRYRSMLVGCSWPLRYTYLPAGHGQGAGEQQDVVLGPLLASEAFSWALTEGFAVYLSLAAGQQRAHAVMVACSQGVWTEAQLLASG